MGTFGSGDTVTRTIYSCPEHTSVTLTYTVFAFSAASDSSITVVADGVSVSQSSLVTSDISQDLDSNGCYADAYKTVSATFSHSAQEMTLEFSSNLIGGFNSQGWAICGIELSFTNTPSTGSEVPETPTTGTETPETPVTEVPVTETTTPETPVTETPETITPETPVTETPTPETPESLKLQRLQSLKLLNHHS